MIDLTADQTTWTTSGVVDLVAVRRAIATGDGSTLTTAEREALAHGLRAAGVGTGKLTGILRCNNTTIRELLELPPPVDRHGHGFRFELT